MIKFTFLLLLLSSISVFASETQMRLDNDIAAGNPIVIHVSVALADNKNQWIVPVPKAIGDGQNARTNLYWGALYGVKTFMTKKADWKLIKSIDADDHRILERIVLMKEFTRKGKTVPVYLVADAWDGNHINDTINQFMQYNSGNDTLTVKADDRILKAGDQAHLIVYIGHNALMDYFGTNRNQFSEIKASKNDLVNDAIVLACKSQPYFSSQLEKLGSHPLLLTTGLMAPEAYSLNAAIENWIIGASDNQVRKAAAKSYSTYQKNSLKASERLFGVVSK